jgi:hypothetical protein
MIVNHNLFLRHQPEVRHPAAEHVAADLSATTRSWFEATDSIREAR